MALFQVPHIRLRAVCAAVPAGAVGNRGLPCLGDTAEAFVRTVGIGSRRVAPPAVCASALCVAAAQRLFGELALDPAAVDVLVFVTQTPDQPVPGNSVLAQTRLGLRRSACLIDVNQGCAGYVYGLAVLAGLLAGTGLHRGLLLVGDTITRLLAPMDRSTVPIFSDAGSATLLERAVDAAPMHFNLGADGAGAGVIQVRGGGAREPFGEDSLALAAASDGASRAPVHLAMRGMDVLHYALTHVAAGIRELLAAAGRDVHAPDYYVFHQANRLLNDSLVRQLGIAACKAPESLADYGNTSCATIPVTICHRLGTSLAQGPTTLVLSGFGSGFSWGSALITTDGVVCPGPVEVDGAHAA